MSRKATERPLVEERRRLLPRRRDVPRRRRRRLRRPRRALRARRLPRRHRRQLPLADAVLSVARSATTATTSPTSTAIDPRLGTHGDLVEHDPHRARPRHPRDRRPRPQPHLDQHPWFQAAREGPDNPYHDFYVWADEKPRGEARRRRLPGPGGLELGVRPQGEALVPAPLLLAPAGPQRRQPGGARRDRADRRLLARAGPERLPARRRAVPVEPMGMPEGAIQDPHELLRDLRAFMARRRGESILLGEVNLPPARRGGRSSASAAATSSTCCSRSPSTRRCTSRSRARTRAPLARRARGAAADPRRTASGRTSSATTTS